MRAFTLTGALLALGAAFGEASKLQPPALPLVVRNPYLSTWLQPARNVPWGEWPMFYLGQHMGLSLMARATDEDIVYPLLGRPHDAIMPVGDDERFGVSFPTYLGATYDASTTNLTYHIPAPSSMSDAKPAKLTLSFLSPITPTSTLRQSIPASYLSVHVEGNFGMDVYIDMNGQWVSADHGSEITWSFSTLELEEGGLKTFQWQRKNEALLTENRDQAEWGSAYLTGPDDVTYESITSRKARLQFARHGKLRDREDNNFRRVMDEEPVFAFAKHFDLDDDHVSASTVFTIAHIQDPVVKFAAARGETLMRPLWASWFPTPEDLLKFHYYDFPNALKLSSAYSDQLAKDAYKSGADDYVNILALSARQVLGATSFSGTPEDPILFLKEISSNGNFQTIDVIFPSFPFFLYTNPRWLSYLLEPLIEHMLSGQYPNDYAMHDLGTHFPNATGHPDGRDEYMPVEECGNILMMGLAVANSLRYETDAEAGSLWATSGQDGPEDEQKNGVIALAPSTQDGIMYIDNKWGGKNKGLKQAQRWVERSYTLWKQWTKYLIDFSLLPENQLCTDDFAGWLALQTNLALKGIIGIRAMSGLSELIGKDDDAKYYRDIAYDYIGKWEEYGISRDKTHAKLAYDWYGSWTTIYNMYGDALLCFHLESENATTTPVIDDGFQKPVHPSVSDKGNTATGFVPKHIYKMQSDWYHAVRQKYGLPLDSRHLYTKTDWEFFAMAVTSEKTRSTILDSVARWVNETSTDRPFTALHKTEQDGGFPGPNFFARPVIGGHFAFLTLERACGGKAMDGLAFLEEESSAEHLEMVSAAAEAFVGLARPYNDEAFSQEL